ncbi:MAG: hypothetical protein QOG80_3199 [Pseudonocardiales bacterium]|jgi:hypothetical protein|nr:hypothetical protein [Pseudonocardiales bacterium]
MAFVDLRSLRPRLRSRAALVTAATLVVGTVLVAGAAPASAGTGVIATSLSGSATLAHQSATGSYGSLTAQADADISVDWNQPASVSVDWTDNLVRQGRQLDPQLAYNRLVPGSMTVTYAVSASLTWDSFVSVGVSASIPASGPCDLLASGPNYTCHLTSSDVSVLDPSIFAVGLPYVDVAISADVTVSPTGIATLRTASFDGTPAGTANLSLPESPITDSLAVPCAAGVGDTLGYQLGTLSATDAISAATSLDFKVGVIAPNPITVTPGFRLQFADENVPLGTSSSSITMSGAGGSESLGTVQANNVPPSLTVASSFSGVEGSPIAFGASASGPCAAGASYVWTFSDGGKEFGANPSHTFTDSGPYSGHVKVTDTTGLTDTQDFTVTVGNLAPNVAVLPSAPTIAWGRSLTVQAQAQDPGTGDQPYLTYAWNFADSTPIQTGGATQTHEWTTPGSYAASVQVCDNDGGCTTSPFTVTVRKRTTSVSYTGDTAGAYSAPTNLAGSLVDEYGQPVNGASLDFTFAGVPSGAALTGPAGTATLSSTVAQSAGTYPVTAGFAGNVLYSATGPVTSNYVVSAMGTNLVYTGTLSGSPNKSVPLSAKLTDNLGRPLAGRVITFVLGSQTTTATTNASGVAATTLVLNQKPNRYSLTVSWPGAAGTYSPSSQSVSFSLNKK